MKTIDYIETIKKTNNVSYYRIAKMLDVNHSTISGYKNKRRFFDEDTSIKVAELLNINPAIVLADISAERAKKRKTKKIWESIAKTLRATTALLLITAIMTVSNNDNALNSTAYSMYNGDHYILC